MLGQPLDVFIPEAVDEVVVHHSNGLHEGITNGRAHKIKAAFLQVFAHRIRLRRLGRNVGQGFPWNNGVTSSLFTLKAIKGDHVIVPGSDLREIFSVDAPSRYVKIAPCFFRTCGDRRVRSGEIRPDNFLLILRNEAKSKRRRALLSGCISCSNGVALRLDTGKEQCLPLLEPWPSFLAGAIFFQVIG